jgi:hypothetical protein
VSARRFAPLRTYLSTAFRWQRGRQGTGYDKMLLLTARWPLPFDSYLLRYPEGSEIPPHTDPVTTGRHYRLNIVLKSPKSGGEFVCANPNFSTTRIKLAAAVMCFRSVGCCAACVESRLANFLVPQFDWG